MRSPNPPVAGRARPRFVVALAGVLLSGAGLTGCGQANPSVVAYVDGTAITQQQLDEAVTGVGQGLQEGQQVSPQAVVNVLIHGEIAAKIAAQEQIAISDADRDAVLTGSNLESLTAIPAARPVAYDVADQQIVAQKLGSQAYLDRLAQQQVTLNPRYGVLDPQQKVIQGDESAALARPAAPTPVP